MKRFRLTWVEANFWACTVEAENETEAKQKYYNGEVYEVCEEIGSKDIEPDLQCEEVNNE
jgi:hypothetical protein